jgi:RHH-type proline utilization regulon transcriptional repressor/proline dehydrogenase/delta 1-pyrroline-5-carboxylate dehydrogenase
MSDFYDLKFADENALVNGFLKDINLNNDRVAQQARVFIETIRARHKDLKGFNALMQSYDLTSEEGLALMTLAEALLRIPDVATANLLIQDKLSDGDWSSLFEQANSVTATISGIGLSLSQKVMDSMIGKIGMPFIRKATFEAMQIMGKTFVLGRDIEEAIKVAKPSVEKGYIYNFDMLGEGARTTKDADYYFNAYTHAIREIGLNYDNRKKPVIEHPGISIKLSALYPRYEFAQWEKAEAILTEKLTELCIIASEYRLNLTVDAEECDRLDLSLSIIHNIIKNPDFDTWEGFGFAVQAYHKRAAAVIDIAVTWAKDYNRKIAIRLVKGAYWDTEIKHAQIEGHTNYPVFTQKENTDLSYLSCAQKLLANRDVLHPMFGTHNAHTVAAVLDMAGDDTSNIIFQRLHGMGDQLYDQILSMDIPVCVYAPVGTHKYLLAYLVRRLLENGANSSFVNQIYDQTKSIDDLIKSPIEIAHGKSGDHYHPHIPLPDHIYGDRDNSKGMDLFARPPLERLFNVMNDKADQSYHTPCLINGNSYDDGQKLDNINPSNRHDIVGQVHYATDNHIKTTMNILNGGFDPWNNRPVADRSAILNKIADLYEDNTHEIMALLSREAGKTIADAIAEVREAVDFCRYYAAQAKHHFIEQELQGPTGEYNALRLEGRGIFLCISPWNFPFAIFTGQIVAALVAGNCVISKPAEQTPAIATYAVKLMLEAGVPENVIALLHGDGDIGAALVGQNIHGVAFTGSTEVAKIIQRQLADKDGPIIPLIAETGGLNAMIVDSTALPEQVTDDVIHSAFGSAGQRCSALRILCVQDDVADEIIPMIYGAMDHLTVGDPQYLSTDIGPIIDEEAKNNLVHYRAKLEGISKEFVESPHDARLDGYGTYFTPIAAEIDDLSMIETEAFGPILHIIRYKEHELHDLIQQINAKGYGLTFGLHSRIETKQNDIANKIRAGNIYINRGQTGAVVGVQPFGGRGLSGTGPKAGGPYYLHAFATEKSISIDTTASGGNATLINL